jgi:hypothetical protein
MTEMYQSGELKKLLGLWFPKTKKQKLTLWAWSGLD